MRRRGASLAKVNPVKNLILLGITDAGMLELLQPQRLCHQLWSIVFFADMPNHQVLQAIK